MDDDWFCDEAAQAEGLTQSLKPPATSIQAQRDARGNQGQCQGTASQNQVKERATQKHMALELERQEKAWESWSRKEPSGTPSWATPKPAAEGTLTAAQATRIHARPGRPAKDLQKDIRSAQVATQAAAKAMAQSQEVAARMLAMAKQQAAQTRMMATAGKLLSPCATPRPAKRGASQILGEVSPDAKALPIAATRKRRATAGEANGEDAVGTDKNEKSNSATLAADNKGASLSAQGEESELSNETPPPGESRVLPTTFAGRYKTRDDKLWEQRIEIYNATRHELECKYPGKKFTKLPSAKQQAYWTFLREHQKENCPAGTTFSKTQESLAEAGKAYRAKLIEEAKAKEWDAAEQAP